MSNQSPTPDDLQRDDDAGIEHLLREVGARDKPSQEISDEIRHAVHAEWRAVVGARLRRRRFIAYGLAASILGIAATTAITWRIATVETHSATIARIDGSPEVVAVDGQRRSTTVGQRIAIGEVLRTNGASRIALDFGNGVTARIDNDSEIAFPSNQHVALRSGAVYVDATPGSGHDRELTVDTNFGAVRHVGTQYQVRILSDGLEVGVREGRVEVTGPRGANAGAAGEKLHVSANGNVIRSALTTHDSSWQWTTAIAPTFNIEDRSLNDFLTWAARETGRKLTFHSPQAQQAAAVKLRGSIEGLDVETAMTAVLSTTQLQRVKTDDESITIALKSAIESNNIERPTP